MALLLSGYDKNRAKKALCPVGVVVVCGRIRLSGLVTLALAQPCVQQLQDGFLHLLRRIERGKYLRSLSAERTTLYPSGFFLLHHDVQHGIVVELAIAGELFHALRLRKRGRSLFAVDGGQEHLLFLRLEVGDFHGGSHADLLLVHHLLKLRESSVRRM